MSIIMNKKNIKQFIESGRNVLVEGAHGTGKTSLIRSVCQDMGLKFYTASAATLDPFVDLVGIPDPSGDVLTFHRKEEFMQADVIFIDEANRAEPKTLNAMMEMVQSRSVNGTKLPNLKCVIAAQNPAGSIYNVEPLDPAIIDRFDMYLATSETPNKRYLTKSPVAEAVIEWAAGEEEYLSPRRVDKIIATFEALKPTGIPIHSIALSTAGAFVSDTGVNRLVAALSGGSIAKVFLSACDYVFDGGDINDVDLSGYKEFNDLFIELGQDSRLNTLTTSAPKKRANELGELIEKNNSN